MGWFDLRVSGSVKQALLKFYTYTYGTLSFTALDCTIVKSRTAYLAVKITDDYNEKCWVIPIIVLLDGGSRSGYNIRFKPFGERDGFYEASCPENILRLLTPLPKAQVYWASDLWTPGLWERDDRDWAKRWRRQCWDNIRHNTATKAIMPDNPVGFTSLWEWRISRFNFNRVGPTDSIPIPASPSAAVECHRK